MAWNNGTRSGDCQAGRGDLTRLCYLCVRPPAPNLEVMAINPIRPERTRHHHHLKSHPLTACELNVCGGK